MHNSLISRKIWTNRATEFQKNLPKQHGVSAIVQLDSVRNNDSFQINFSILHQRFSNVFREYKMEASARYGLNSPQKNT